VARRRKRAALAGALALLLAAAYYLLPRRSQAPDTAYRFCTRVVDGDTIVLDGNEHIRLIGVDTPEKNDSRPDVRRLALAATNFTRGLCEGRRVRLEYDGKRQDRYGRTLAYVYLGDGAFVNAEIVRQGYGFAYTRSQFRFLDDFRAELREARDAGRGLWKR
jgi:micrococcal nuclease